MFAQWFNQWVRLFTLCLLCVLVLPLAGCAAAPELNSLSWLIYVASVADPVKVWLAVIAALCVLGWGVGTFINSVCAEEWKPVPYRWVVLAAALSLTSTLVPSQNTLYAIAASQVGEQLLKSETVHAAAKATGKAVVAGAAAAGSAVADGGATAAKEGIEAFRAVRSWIAKQAE